MYLHFGVMYEAAYRSRAERIFGKKTPAGMLSGETSTNGQARKSHTNMFSHVFIG